jgi:hypothetical protein
MDPCCYRIVCPSSILRQRAKWPQGFLPIKRDIPGTPGIHMTTGSGVAILDDDLAVLRGAESAYRVADRFVAQSRFRARRRLLGNSYQSPPAASTD